MADIRGLKEVERTLKNLRRVAPSACRVALQKCGAFAMREAKANAPKSPTMKILSATFKRKKRTSRKMMPGGLERSIEYKVADNGKAVSIFVSSNSFAAKYAKRIHDDKGRTWQKRGPGTVAKGARADDKFILRAIKNNAGKYTAIVKGELAKALRRYW